MATIKFKTNAKCGGCVAAIGAKLNTLMASDDWSIWPIRIRCWK